MDAKQFNAILEAQLERSTTSLLNKNGAYNPDEDRIASFKTAARLGKTNSREALSGMMIKHTVSIYDMISSGKQYPVEVWNEKITDHINYLLLLRAVIEEDDAIKDANTHSSDSALAALREKLTGTSAPPASLAPAVAIPTDVPGVADIKPVMPITTSGPESVIPTPPVSSLSIPVDAKGLTPKG